MFIVKCVIGRLLPFKKEGIEFRASLMKCTNSDFLNSESINLLKPNNLENKNPFRLTAKQLFLTYNETTLEKDDALSQLQTILNNSIKDYIIAQLKNQNGTFNLYAYLSLKYKINIISSKKLDLRLSNGEIIHGKYQTVKNKSELINFLKKSDNYITNLIDDEPFYLELYKLAKNSNLDAALDFFETHRPEWISTRFKNIRSNLQAYIKNNKKRKNLSLKKNLD